MTYDQSAALMVNATFRGRVKVAALNYAGSIMAESPTVTAHNARMRWASLTFQQPDMAAQQIQGPTVMDPAVQAADIDPADGDSTIPDAGLQAAVEAVVNKMI